jgi:heme/copper-type cytochrome/quinol oxidase subunit 4
MNITNIIKVYDEYRAILSLLIDKNFLLEETISIVDITLKQGFDLNLLKELGSVISFFNLNCNPFSDDYEDIIIDLEKGYKSISEITSISLNIEKEFVIGKISNIPYVFFDKKLAINSIKSIPVCDNSYKINIGIINNEDIQTELINFINFKGLNDISEVLDIPISEETVKHIEFYLSNNRNKNHTYYHNPYSFVINSSHVTDSEFIQLIKNEFFITMLQSLSDKENEGTFIIRGEKNVVLMKEKIFLTNNYKSFVDVFKFLISHQKYTEKFIITKKVITLYIQDKETFTGLDEKLPEIWKTINHYYDHYIEDNLKEFFKTKDQLLKEAMNVSKVIYEQTDKIGNSIIASIISTIILLITTLYRTLENLNIVYSGIFIFIFLVFSVIYYLLMSDSTKKRFKLTEGQFEHFIKEISLIRSEEVEIIREKYLKNPYTELKRTLNKLLILLLIINTILIMTFLVYICIKYGYCIC